MENHPQSDVQMNANCNSLSNGKRIVSVSQVTELPEYKSWLTENALRHMLFKSKPRFNGKGEKQETNGLEEFGAVIRIGRKILIDLDAFDKWVESHKA